MTPQSMSEVIDALEQKGLIERNRHPNHRRAYPAALTDRGRGVLNACDLAIDGLEDEMLAALTPQQQRNLRSSLITAVRALRAGFPER